MIILIVFAFLSGIVTILSPCILPMLPIILSGSVGSKKKPYGIVLGFITSFTIFSLTLSTIVNMLKIPDDALRNIAILFIITFGLIMILPKLKEKYEKLVSRFFGKRSNKKQGNGFTGGVFVGLSLGLIWTPCVGPIMASIITLAITQTVDIASVLIIIAYTLGTSIPMLIIIQGGRKIFKRIPNISKYFGVIMVLVGLSLFFGLDRKFQTFILEKFPNYGSGLTFFETTSSVNEALKERNKNDSIISYENQPKNGKLGNYGFAPEFIIGGEWINSTPLTMNDLKGKVVIIDFWTYSCVNCIRTTPYLKSWYDAYKDDGLVIIGIHAPEFVFERDIKNVTKAANEMEIDWPILLDNNFEMWGLYNNSYWPSKYFIDANGEIRYYHFGEGGYDSSKKVIEKLLEESGNKPENSAEKLDITKKSSKTHEVYLGSIRGSQTYNPKLPGEWKLNGEWVINGEYIQSIDNSELILQFDARTINLVIENLGTGTIEVLVDDEIVNTFIPVQNKMYNIVNLKKSKEHTLKLRVEGKLRLFAFTFGG